MTEHIQWQTLASQDLDIEQRPHLRISGAGNCPRAQAYAFQGEEESNPSGVLGQNRMAMGHMAEILIIREMHRAGWQTEHTVLSERGQLELEVKIPGTDISITGHPDGICRHPEYTNGQWVTLECKSMGVDRGLEVERHDIASVYPKYIKQICLYASWLFEKQMVSHAQRGIFGLMDRDGRILPPERVSWAPDTADKLLLNLRDIVQQVQAGGLPGRPHVKSSTECRYCSYHSLCWGDDPPADERRGPAVTLSDEESVTAARNWAEFKPKVDRARDLLQEVSDRNEGADVTAAGVVGGYFRPRNEKIYDPETLERMVPADILKKCRTNVREKPPAFWVRAARD